MKKMAESVSHFYDSKFNMKYLDLIKTIQPMDVTMGQMVEKLPNSDIPLKDNRVFYKFDSP